MFLFRKYKLNAVWISILIFLMEKNMTFKNVTLKLLSQFSDITRSFELLLIALNKSKVYTTITYVAWYINRLLQKRKNCFWNFHLSANWTRHTYIKSNVILSSNWCVILFLFEFTSSWSSLFNLKKRQFQHDFSSSLTFRI